MTLSTCVLLLLSSMLAAAARADDPKTTDDPKTAGASCDAKPDSSSAWENG